MSGVVGTMTPRYCLFGDMVNTTSRHESTGEPGKIQCSSATYERLTHFTPHPEYYNFTPRGLVEMKGKGKLYTYWLDGAGSDNPSIGPAKLQSLRDEVQEMLDNKTWRKRRYFERRSTNSSFSSQDVVFVETSEWNDDDEKHSLNDERETSSQLPSNGQESAILKLQFYRQPTESLRYVVDDDDFFQQIRRESFKLQNQEDSTTTSASHDMLDENDSGQEESQNISNNSKSLPDYLPAPSNQTLETKVCSKTTLVDVTSTQPYEKSNRKIQSASLKSLTTNQTVSCKHICIRSFIFISTMTNLI
jgi:hypothetical protein